MILRCRDCFIIFFHFPMLPPSILRRFTPLPSFRKERLPYARHALYAIASSAAGVVAAPLTAPRTPLSPLIIADFAIRCHFRFDAFHFFAIITPIIATSLSSMPPLMAFRHFRRLLLFTFSPLIIFRQIDFHYASSLMPPDAAATALRHAAAIFAFDYY
jgi:hypothetical protein